MNKQTPSAGRDLLPEACSRRELEYLAERGSYGQRLIAKRYLAQILDKEIAALPSRVKKTNENPS